MGVVENSVDLGLDIPGLSEEDRGRLKIKYERWDKLIERGAIIELHITGWPATTSIDDNAMEMIGIPLKEQAEREAYKAVVRMGQISLIPAKLRKEQNRLDQQARIAVSTASRKLIVGNFVPEPQILPLLDDLAEKRENYLKFAREEIVGRLEQHVQDMREHHRVIFGSAYDRLAAQGTYLELSRDEFIDNASNYLYRNLPSAEEIADKYTFKYDIHIVPFRDRLAERELNYKRIMEKAAQSEERVEELTRETQKRLDAEMKEQAKPRALALLKSIDEAEQAMLSVVSSSASEILNALEKNGSLPGSNASQLKNMLDQIKMFRQSGMLDQDDNLDTSIAKLDDIVKLYKEYNSKERKEQAPELAQTLRSIRASSDRIIEELPQVRIIRRDISEVEDVDIGELESRQIRQDIGFEEVAAEEEEIGIGRVIREDDEDSQ